MKNTNKSGVPFFYGWKTLTTSVTLLFMVLLGTSLVMLPLASKQNKTCILNTVEEEAGTGNPINEENKNGKTFSVSLIDYTTLLGTIHAEDLVYIIPISENIPDDLHSQTLIQPPDQA